MKLGIESGALGRLGTPGGYLICKKVVKHFIGYFVCLFVCILVGFFFFLVISF